MTPPGRATFSIFAPLDGDEDSSSSATAVPSVPPSAHRQTPRPSTLPSTATARKENYVIEHQKACASFPYETSSLGPQDSWTPSFMSYYSMAMIAPFPSMLIYGPELVLIYNAEFGHVLGLDPGIYFGRSFSELWVGSDLNFELSEALRTCTTTGRSVTKENLLCFVTNPDTFSEGGMNKEAYLTWKLTPVTEADGTISGVFASVQDTTDAVLYERRMQVLKELYDATGSAEVLDVFYTQSVSVLRRACAEDIALFGLYVLDSGTAKTLRYRCGFGLRNFPDRISFSPEQELFEQAILDSSLSAVYITAMADGFRNYIEYDPARGWSEEIIELVFLPVMRDNNSVVGVAVIGLNPRRPFDEPYELFLELLGRQLATGIDNLRHLEEASDKLSWEVTLSTRKRQELEQLLQEKTKQLQISEGRFSRMAKILPAGLFLASPEGEVMYANDAWYKLSSYPKDGNPSFWIKAVHPGDRALVRESWRRVMLGKSERIEFRWAHRPGEVSKVERWCASAVSAEFDSETGKLSTLTGVWTDITERKQSEALQRQRADDAVERKRQQEYFIDAISHEMRNPLSAIMQSIDVASERLKSLEWMIEDSFDRGSTLFDAQAFKDGMAETTEALGMMDLCTSHLNRIITDTIDLSKMESGLFPVNPVSCQPVTVVREVLKMHEHELKNMAIDYSIEIGENFREIGINTVLMDPLRVRQVLINLILNAMKVLSSWENEKKLIIKLDASLTKPTFQSHNNASFYLQHPAVAEATERRNSSANVVYLLFSVKDTGSGMDPEQLATAFQRFTSHFAPRTHVHYGGTGLGLYVSRKLVENQGGEIMAETKKDHGSEFVFYIKAHMKEQDEDDTDLADITESVTLDEEDDEGRFSRSRIRSSESKFLTTASSSMTSMSSIRMSRSNRSSLIVQDNIINQKLLNRQFINAGFATVIANHGQEAVDIVMSGEDPDCCIMDYEMPVMDGFTAVSKIRELERQNKKKRRRRRRHGRLPIIALSANTRQVHFDRMLAAGSDRYVTKPFSFPKLVEVVNELLHASSGERTQG
ncbi:hypothetical protein BZA70DRAFT_234017 [Myxozyma melibiosi]|uniref:histidine kinase n=1 Tax=Myxozyma melibiosi TaxID=54550 RepID=A0ABR1FDR2_9ASCO